MAIILNMWRYHVGRGWKCPVVSIVVIITNWYWGSRIWWSIVCHPSRMMVHIDVRIFTNALWQVSILRGHPTFTGMWTLKTVQRSVLEENNKMCQEDHITLDKWAFIFLHLANEIVHQFDGGSNLDTCTRLHHKVVAQVHERMCSSNQVGMVDTPDCMHHGQVMMYCLCKAFRIVNWISPTIVHHYWNAD